MRGLAQARQRFEKSLERPRLAEPPKALPHAVPIAELRRKRPPSDVMNGKIMQRFQKLAVVVAGSPRFERTAWNTSMAIDQSSSVICVSITGPSKSRSPMNHRKTDLGIHFASTDDNPSTGPSTHQADE